MEFLAVAYALMGFAACSTAGKAKAPAAAKTRCLLLFPAHVLLLSFLGFWWNASTPVVRESDGFWTWLWSERK
jgi:hypothetical protein